MNVGRTRNADPRWLIPLICRRGHITKREIGSIRISDRETRFEIARHAAERFAAMAARPDRRTRRSGSIRCAPAAPSAASGGASPAPPGPA